MRVAIDLVKTGEQACGQEYRRIDGLAKLRLNAIDGIERPALVSALPNRKKW